MNGKSSSLDRTKNTTRPVVGNGNNNATNHNGATESSVTSSSTISTIASNNSSDRLDLLSKTSRFKYGEIYGMDVIEKSPYEPKLSAEADEPLFETLKMLLLSNEELHGEAQDMDGVPTLTIQADAIGIFGKSLAEAFVKAFHIIGKSGMLFSPSWVDQKECKIRNVKCGWIPKTMMLLLLQHQRFARASDANLQSVVGNLGVTGIFFDALEDWELDEPFLLHNAPSLNFDQRKRVQCLKCVIFIARAYRCTKLLRQNPTRDDHICLEEEHPTLYAKVQQCLKILNENVKVHAKKLEMHIAAKEASTKATEEKRATKEHFGNIHNKRRRRSSTTGVLQVPTREVTTSLESSVVAISNSPSPPPPPPPPAPIEGGVPQSLAPSPVVNISPPIKASRTSQQQQHQQQAVVASSSRHVSAEVLLERATTKFRQLGRVIKKLKKQIHQDRETLKEELRREILLEERKKEQGRRLGLGAGPSTSTDSDSSFVVDDDEEEDDVRSQET